MKYVILRIGSTIVESEFWYGEMRRRVDHRDVINKGCIHQSFEQIIHPSKLLGSACPFGFVVIIFPNAILPFWIGPVRGVGTLFCSTSTFTPLLSYVSSNVFLWPFLYICRSAGPIGLSLTSVTNVFLLNILLAFSLH